MFYESEEFYRNLIAQVKDYAIFTTDPRGVITTWNGGRKNALGYDREPTRAAWNQVVEGVGAFDVEYRIRGADGNYRRFKTRAVPLRSEEGEIILRQVVWNLLSNAIKFTPEGGRIVPAIERRQAQLKVSATPSLSGIKVLVVDDDEDAREMLRAALNSYGAEVITTTGASQALDALASENILEVVVATLAKSFKGYD